MTDASIEFAIQPSSGVPIYRQIMEQMCALIVSGRLTAGTLVPSIRELSADLQVNMMTVSKAYSRLEADGVLERVRGTGMRVRPIKTSGGVAERQKELEPLVAALVTRGAIELIGSTDSFRCPRCHTGATTVAEAIIHVEELTKSYNKTAVLQGVNLSIPGALQLASWEQTAQARPRSSNACWASCVSIAGRRRSLALSPGTYRPWQRLV